MTHYSAEETEKTFAWARYLYWTDIHRRRLDEWVEQPDREETTWGSHFFALASQFYAFLYVSLEGWRRLRFENPVVDALLESSPDYVDLLRRFRNSVFHYRPRLIEERYAGFIADSEVTVPWSVYLHDEFCGDYWRWLHGSGGTPEQVQEIRELAWGIVGWLPEEAICAQMTRHLEWAEGAKTKVLTTEGDRLSPHGRAVLESVRDLERTVSETTERSLAQKLEFIREKLKQRE